MYINNKLLIGKNEKYEAVLLPKMSNRHGLVTGASGTGKTTTVKVMAESFSELGVPVFVADVKGDLSGCCKAGEENENILKRVKDLKLEDFDFKAFPVRFWDLYQKNGHAIKASIYDIGASILSMMLGLTETQESILTLIYRIAHDEEKMIYNISDLRKLLQYVGEHRNEYTLKYGNITTQSIGVIERSLLALEDQGADKFFGLPSFDIKDLLKTKDEMGYINILHAVELFNSPDLYVSFLLYLLTKLYKDMPEVGDLDKPKIVFFFDEAHLLFNNMPSYRLKQIVGIVKLIRSKGIGLYFISQCPSDIPDEVLSQLSNRIQHALRAYTPSEQKAVKAAADSFRVNPNLKTMDEILALGTGEALVSFLNESGEPEIVNKVKILPPESFMGTIDAMERNKIINNSEFVGKYEEEIVKDDAAHLVLDKIYTEEKEKQEALEAAKELEKQKKEEQKALLEKQKLEAQEKREAEKKKREEEKALKSSVGYKLGKKVVNKTVDKAINKGLNSIFKSIFK
ncbi:MAG: DUF853 family protein [Bacilli bacterium]|nr:DUF853 family protein [Bacilli bacterium]